MKKQINPSIKAQILRSAFMLLSLVAISAIPFALAQSRSPGTAKPSVAASAIRAERTLTFADRVTYQRAIEEVYWQHRIWPKANAGSKPPLDKVMSQTQIEKKVEDYLRNSQALEDYWQRPVTPDQLQVEMERIATHTKQPEMLREIFAALDNDPFVIAECLARPVLAERLLSELYAHDQRFHGELKQRAEADLQTHPSVSQMRQTSGTYTEMELIKRDDNEKVAHTSRLLKQRPASKARALQNQDSNPIALSSAEWNEMTEKLAGEFGNAPKGDAWEQVRTNALSPLQEDENHYYAVAVTHKGKDRLKLATIAWLKEPLRSWLTKAEAQVPVTMAAVTADYTLPVIAGPSGGCTDDTWTPTSLTNAPLGRSLHTAVWTGSEMIVWGGYNGFDPFNTGGRYNASTDSWTATSTVNAPFARVGHTAVWTGIQMIVWGGQGVGSTGGRYSPNTDSWTVTSTINAPTGRGGHTAVWTGSEMIVWGGYQFGVGDTNTGGRYNPNTDSWAATSTTNAPSARLRHTAVWTGSEMIVWGGITSGPTPTYFNTGGRYSPGTDSWTGTSTINAPTARADHTAVWSATQMIVWGGFGPGGVLNTGGGYNPVTDTWTGTSPINAPSARSSHTAVWTNNDEMIVWGGGDNGGDLNTGGRYNGSWTPTSTTGAPAARSYHTAVWAGSQMIVWGGDDGINYFNTGGRYCAQSQTPTPTPTPTAPATATPTPTPCTGRCTPTPRPRPTPAPRP